MKIGTAFPSKWIKADDLNGQRVEVVIDSVGFEDIGDDNDKLVVYFRGKKKGLVLNRTNANMISEIAQDEETDRWPGVKIVLFPTKTDFGGKRVPCVRVDVPAGKQEEHQQKQPGKSSMGTASFNEKADDSDAPF